MNIFRVRNKQTWLPSASLKILKKRANALATIRDFFHQQQVMEVDVPILSSATVPDPYLDSISVKLDLPNIGNQLTHYLHTSPEYTMKRLLCAGSGDIYYLGKVFRQGDLSPRHQPEFTMLEWYRLDFSLQQMMAETAKVIQLLLGNLDVEFISYQQAFQDYASIKNIHKATATACKDCLADNNIAEIVGVDETDKSLWEQLILTEIIEPKLGNKCITCLHHYPAKDAALAKISADGITAERFEIFVNNMEIANGYLELQDAKSYQQRFEKSLQQRKKLAKPQPKIDKNLLASLTNQGLPNCSGVALGVDRLIMLAEKQSNIEQILPFSIQNN